MRGVALNKLFELFRINSVRLSIKKITRGRKIYSGCSVARLSRLLWEQEVAGSNPATPTIKAERKRSAFSFKKVLSLLKILF